MRCVYISVKPQSGDWGLKCGAFNPVARHFWAPHAASFVHSEHHPAINDGSSLSTGTAKTLSNAWLRASDPSGYAVRGVHTDLFNFSDTRIDNTIAIPSSNHNANLSDSSLEEDADGSRWDNDKMAPQALSTKGWRGQEAALYDALRKPLLSRYEAAKEMRAQLGNCTHIDRRRNSGKDSTRALYLWQCTHWQEEKPEKLAETDKINFRVRWFGRAVKTVYKTGLGWIEVVEKRVVDFSSSMTRQIPRSVQRCNLGWVILGAE